MQDKLFSRSEGSTLNSLRRRIDRFCVLHPNFGIPNLMLYIVIGNIAFYLLSLFSTLDGGSFYSILSFSWAGLKQGAALAAAVLQLSADDHQPLLAAGELLFLLLDRLDARARVGYGEVHHLLPQRRAPHGSSARPSRA